jgi:hypothetical protein
MRLRLLSLGLLLIGKWVVFGSSLRTFLVLAVLAFNLLGSTI